MLSDPMTLYKLMNLYMLKHVNFPLTNSQLTDFFLAHEYATYFTLQQALNELSESGLIRMQSNHNMTRYEITREGEETLEFFGKNIPPAIVTDMEEYLEKHRFRMRNAAGLTADYYKTDNQDYMVHCEIREGKSLLLDLKLSVPDQGQAESMCSQWEKKSQEIYSYIMKSLFADS
ncbi:MAG: DUF4364 family protein [Hungatella sp.]|nr:DUF4364 family protein [Hungatella sp.]